MYTVATRRLPVATRRYTAPTRSDTDNFSSVYSGTKNCAGLIFPRTCRITPDDAGCLPGVYTDDAGDNTDHPGLRSGMIRDAIRECVKAPWDLL